MSSGNGRSIIVVDDEAAARTALAEILRDEGYSVETAGDGFKALARIEHHRPALVLTDLRMPGMDGFELIRRMRGAGGGVPVVVMTAFGGVDTAVRALREGATDFVTKPLDVEQLLAVIERALPESVANDHTTRPEPAPIAPLIPQQAATSREMQLAQHLAASAARTRAPVLVAGERGTGRTTLARRIHAASGLSARPLVELSGAELTGSFATDPLAARDGLAERLEAARGGALLLRELQDLSSPLQAVLSSTLGGERSRGAGCGPNARPRLLATCTEGPRALIAGGRLREDLFYQLAVVTVELPPLRHRRVDLIPLVEHLLAQRAEALGRTVPTLTASARTALLGHPWPGNVAELVRVLDAALDAAPGAELRREHLDLDPADAGAHDAPPVVPGSTLEEIERYAILRTLEAQAGSTRRAARVLGMSVRKIQYKLREYGRACD